MFVLRRFFLAGILLLMAGSTMAADTLTLARIRSLVTIPMADRGLIELSITADWPVTASPQLSTTLQAWSRNVMSQLVNDVKTADSPHPFLSRFESLYVDAAVQEATVALATDKDKAFSMALDAKMERVYESRAAITFRLSGPRYGLDGLVSDVNTYATFVKTTGEEISWTGLLNPKTQKRFVKVLTSQLRSFFGVNSFENMMLSTTVPPETTDQTFPLPKNPPALCPDGIRVMYEPGEIADAAIGRPMCIIPYTAVRSYLSSEGKKWTK